MVVEEGKVRNPDKREAVVVDAEYDVAVEIDPST